MSVRQGLGEWVKGRSEERENALRNLLMGGAKGGVNQDKK